MKKLSALIIGYLFCTTISCRMHRSAENMLSKKVDHANHTYVEAEVADMTGLDGCGWMLRIQGERLLEPRTFPDSLKKNGLKVEVSYHDSSFASVCMAGHAIIIKDIRRKKK